MEDTLRAELLSFLKGLLPVLILVLMEDTLRVKQYLLRLVAAVLILVLMEDTLRVATLTRASYCIEVLILVLMEDTLRGESGCPK